MGHLAINGGAKVREAAFPKWPVHGDEERRAVLDVLESGEWGGVSQRLVPKFEELFAAFQQCDYGVSCTNGTAALEIAIRALGIGFGDEVILSPYTFIASATAIVLNNAIPVFVDIDPETYLINPDAIEAAITPKTRAIMAIHIAGQSCDMDAILQIADKHKLAVIEDCAQAHGAEWAGQRVGSFGKVGCFSFQSSKNMTAGEGGIIVTTDQEVYDQCWSIHNVGRIPGGRWYQHRNLGSNFRMTEWQAAVLLPQLERLPEHMRIREANGKYLAKKLGEVPGMFSQKRDGKVTSHAYHLFIMRYNKDAFGGVPRDKFVQAMCAEGIPCSGGYVPLYQAELFNRVKTEDCPFTCRHTGRKMDYSAVSCPACEHASAEEAVWLTQSMLLGPQTDMDSVVEAAAKVQKYHSELEES